MYVGRYPTTETDSVRFFYVKDINVLFYYPLSTQVKYLRCFSYQVPCFLNDVYCAAKFGNVKTRDNQQTAGKSVG